VTTRRLLLLRHAKSSWDDPTLDDHERPLAPRGLKATKRLSRWIEAYGVAPDLVLCSTATRAQETLARVAASLGSPPVHVEDRLYHASVEGLLARIGLVGNEIETLLVVGHNPGLEELCSVLTGSPATMPTGALATLVGEVERWADLAPGRLSLESLVIARELG
jgi:phosphohistidine phosphatase